MEVKKNEKANLEHKRGLFLQLGFVISISLILIAFEWTSQPEGVSDLTQMDDMEFEEEVIPVTRREEAKPPPPPPPPKVTEVLNIVDDDVEIEDELVIEDMEADQETEMQIVEFDDEEEAEEEEVFFIVEDMPTFRGGGLEAFRKFVQSNLEYPQIAAENGISGRVFVQFVVNQNGQVINAKVVRGVDPSLDKEALRVVNSSPSWTPGRQRGKPVRVAFTLPIVFVLQ